MFKRKLLTGFLLCSCLLKAYSQDISSQLNRYNVVWNEPGPTSFQSMPIGNGDIGLNVWTEPSGDINFYISKTDAWGEETEKRGSWMAEGGVLMKLGKVRVSFPEVPFKQGDVFSQILKLKQGEIQITRGSGQNEIIVKIWVDANNPVVRIESQSKQKVLMNVTLDNWRLNAGDKIVDAKNAIEWYHRNSDKADTAIRNIVFGAKIKGANFINQNNAILVSQSPQTQQAFAIYPLTKRVTAIEDWNKALQTSIEITDAKDIGIAKASHYKWWNTFWNRSWVFVTGDSLADKVTQGYVLQRFVTACAGRGAYPIKFNGTIFTMDNPAFKQDGKAHPMNADFREWGGQYWFQNTRAMYWPMLASGDFEMMKPLFKMYADLLPANRKQVRQYYKHDGAYFAETTPFWGGLTYVGPEVPENWTAHYFTPILELSMMMLDYYQYTGDEKFARETLLPVASEGLRFYDQHFPRDNNGKLLMDSVNSIEMYWKVHNPAPDIAGLHVVTKRLLELPSNMVSTNQRKEWSRFLSELPELPIGEKNKEKILLPYTGPQTARGRNLENPELYAVYPFRMYGIGKNNLDMAVHTFQARIWKDKGCWVQDPIQAAMLGLGDVAKEYVSFNLTRKSSALKFPAFWDRGHDYAPDQDNGGNGLNGLQQMLLYVDGKKIFLLPAWPKGWNANFKLNAPYNTTIQASVKNGKIEKLQVFPASRAKDVQIL